MSREESEAIDMICWTGDNSVQVARFLDSALYSYDHEAKTFSLLMLEPNDNLVCRVEDSLVRFADGVIGVQRKIEPFASTPDEPKKKSNNKSRSKK